MKYQNKMLNEMVGFVVVTSTSTLDSLKTDTIGTGNQASHVEKWTSGLFRFRYSKMTEKQHTGLNTSCLAYRGVR